ncbi:hypothetical protein BDW22DRAFT_1352270 [Trametopsis cervina]|nr:hypothetical protein BDW22DRAFT_1352270 [Trametopsis cervina]
MYTLPHRSEPQYRNTSSYTFAQPPASARCKSAVRKDRTLPLYDRDNAPTSKTIMFLYPRFSGHADRVCVIISLRALNEEPFFLGRTAPSNFVRASVHTCEPSLHRICSDGSRRPRECRHKQPSGIFWDVHRCSSRGERGEGAAKRRCQDRSRRYAIVAASTATQTDEGCSSFFLSTRRQPVEHCIKSNDQRHSLSVMRASAQGSQLMSTAAECAFYSPGNGACVNNTVRWVEPLSRA